MPNASSSSSHPRVVAIVGPYTAGKTTLLEALLFAAGAIPLNGSVAAGTSVCDACFTGNYVVPVTTNERDWILAQRRA